MTQLCTPVYIRFSLMTEHHFSSVKNEGYNMKPRFFQQLIICRFLYAAAHPQRAFSLMALLIIPPENIRSHPSSEFTSDSGIFARWSIKRLYCNAFGPRYLYISLVTRLSLLLSSRRRLTFKFSRANINLNSNDNLPPQLFARALCIPSQLSTRNSRVCVYVCVSTAAAVINGSCEKYSSIFEA